MNDIAWLEPIIQGAVLVTMVGCYWRLGRLLGRRDRCVFVWDEETTSGRKGTRFIKRRQSNEP